MRVRSGSTEADVVGQRDHAIDIHSDIAFMARRLRLNAIARNIFLVLIGANAPPMFSLSQGAIGTSGFDHAQLTADAGEGIDRAVQMLARMRCAHLRADTRLTLRHHREEEADRINAFFQKALGEALR